MPRRKQATARAMQFARTVGMRVCRSLAPCTTQLAIVAQTFGARTGPVYDGDLGLTGTQPKIATIQDIFPQLHRVTDTIGPISGFARHFLQEAAKSAEQTHHFYFSNTCDLTLTVLLLDAKHDWLPALMEWGASEYLGALWKISDQPSRNLSKHLDVELAAQPRGKGSTTVTCMVTQAHNENSSEAYDPRALVYIVADSPLPDNARKRPAEGFCSDNQISTRGR